MNTHILSNGKHTGFTIVVIAKGRGRATVRRETSSWMKVGFCVSFRFKVVVSFPFVSFFFISLNK